MDRRAPAPVVVLLGMLLTGGCADDDAGSCAAPVNGDAALTEEEAFACIPLDGVEGSPLHWEVPEVADADAAAALLAARRFVALDHYVDSQPAADWDHLYQWVATPRLADKRSEVPHHPDFSPRTGPSWSWVIDVEQISPVEVLVRTCRDPGWRKAAGDAEDVPGPGRGALRRYEVVKQDVGDEQRWLVDRYGPILSPPGPQVRRECEQWATHEPPAA